MKASIVGLVVSTAAFGVSTAYFWNQASQVREQAELVAEANKRLNQRVSELEKAREEFMNRRMARGPDGPNPFVAGSFNEHGAPVVNPANAQSAEAVAGNNGKDGERPFPVFNRAQMPPSMVKTMRNQVRAQNERTYFDLQSRLGLSEADANKLLDLITEQQTMGFGRSRDPSQVDALRNDRERIDGEISDLLGPTKAAEYANYQKEMPARMEVAMLATQFESSEAPLNDTQRARLVAALSEERETVPMPSYTSGASQDEYRKSYESWQADYEQRVGERARSILNSTQLQVYEEYQQFQKDMRSQMAASGRMMPGNFTMMGGRVGGGRMAAPPPPPPPK